MKFSCEKCGRTYAADEKVRGRAFKMKCKQCGHLIVVKPERVGAAAGSPAGPSAGLHSPTPPAIDLDSSSTDAFAAAPDPFATAADPFAASADPFAAQPPPPAPAPRPAFDPFAEPPSAAKNGGQGLQQPGPAVAVNESDAAFADLGREMASGTGGQPLASPPGTGGQPLATPPARPLVAAPVPRPLPPAPAPSAPVAAAAPPRAPAAPAKGQAAKKSPLPLVLGAGAALAVVGVVGWFALGSGPTPAPARPAPRPAPVAAAPARPPAEKPAQPPAPVAPPAAAPQAVMPPSQAPLAVAPVEPAPMPPPAAAPAHRAPAKAKAPPPPPPKKVAKVAPHPEPKPQPAPPPPPPKVEPAKPEPRPAVAYKPTPQPATSPGATAHPAQPSASASASGEAPPLDQARVEATFAKHRGSLDACVAQARKNEPGVNLDGRTVNVTMTVNPNGKALYPTLDDVELNGTELGNCLKRETGKIQFPAFGGDAIRVTKPIVLK